MLGATRRWVAGDLLSLPHGSRFLYPKNIQIAPEVRCFFGMFLGVQILTSGGVTGDLGGAFKDFLCFLLLPGERIQFDEYF